MEIHSLKIVDKILNSDYSITESRVLYELHKRKECTADDIVRQLHLDKGYLSRIIKRFEKEELLKRQKSELDARSYKIHLTGKGIGITEELIERSNQGIRRLTEHLSEEEFIEYNTDWIVDNFGFLEKEDKETFKNIEEDIKNGAMIYFAVEGEEVLAVCMAKYMQDGTWEICKLASRIYPWGYRV